jgi:hypothetical protein
MSITRIIHTNKYKKRASMRLKLFDQVPARNVSDIIRVLLYRTEFFGKPYAAATHDALRGPSDWSAGERELFAAFVSSLNHCPF